MKYGYPFDLILLYSSASSLSHYHHHNSHYPSLLPLLARQRSWHRFYPLLISLIFRQCTYRALAHDFPSSLTPILNCHHLVLSYLCSVFTYYVAFCIAYPLFIYSHSLFYSQNVSPFSPSHNSFIIFCKCIWHNLGATARGVNDSISHFRRHF